MVRLFKIVVCLFYLLIYNQVWSGPEEYGESHLITLNLNNVSLRNTLQLLADRLGKNLLLDPEFKEKTLNLSLKNLTTMEAFNAILEANDLAYKELEGNIIFVAEAEKIGKQTVVKNITCRYASAEELESILNKMVVSEFGSVMADKRTNTLIIKESQDVLAKMEKMIAELDKPIKQVYIQAEIIEVSSRDDTELGTEWLWKTANFKSFQGQVGTDFRLQSDPTLGQNNTQKSDEFPFPVSAGLGIGLLNSDITSVLHALNEVNDLNLLSRPRVITMDNQQAVIEVGDQIPFKVLNEFGVTSFEFKNATVELLVKPHIIDSSFIMLEVAPKADFQNGTTADGTPIIATRKASTKVKVRDGQTIVIGGLIRDSKNVTQQKVPLLGSIPLLGFLFKNQKTTNIKTELVVFITPHILKDEKPSNMFKQDFKLRNKMQRKLK